MSTTLSSAWVASLVADLARHGRTAEGGWPGTRSEARRLLARHLSNSRSPQLDRERIERLVDAIYKGAKKTWEKQATRMSFVDDEGL